MTATWRLDTHVFKENVKKIIDKTPTIAVVKNNAYNYGLSLAVDLFQEVGITMFATTSLDEAIQIRELSSNATIFLMNPTTHFEELREYDIQMTLPSLAFYRQHWQSMKGIKVHLEYENLLHRSGFKTFQEMKEVIILNQQYANKEKMDITGIWTHFGYADEFEISEYEQEKSQWLDGLEELLTDYSFEYIHSQNSASFMREGLLIKQTHARLGIILYGCRPYSELDSNLVSQSLTVSGNVVQIRELQKDESCGYSFTFTATKETKLAVVDIGYGDGILRTRVKGESCLIHGTRYPIRGLMMSHLLVEVDDKVSAGDEVAIYSPEIRIDEFTFKGIGANSEQLSALNHCSLRKEII